MEDRISGTTRLYALIGSPVGHSGSPAMHNYSFKRLGIDSVYVAFDVDREHTEDAMKALRTFNMGGMNVTMPLKTEVIKYMDELSDAARIMGAVNTIVNDNGRLIGHNTDGCGFVDNLRDKGVTVAGKRIAIAGGGGAATAIIVQCALDGAAGISIFKRKNATFAKTEELAAKLAAERPELAIGVYDIADTDGMTEIIRESDIFINATSVGMKPNDGETIVKDTGAFQEDLVVADVVYNPLETRLLKEAKEAGVAKCVNGKGMLLWQGVAAFKLFTGQDMPVEEVKERFFAT